MRPSGLGNGADHPVADFRKLPVHQQFAVAEDLLELGIEERVILGDTILEHVLAALITNNLKI